MIKLLALDRDGVLNIDDDYVYKVEKYRWNKNVFQGLREFVKNGYKLYIVTNQSGIARGYFTVQDIEVLNTYIKSKMLSEGIVIEDVFYCPHLEEGVIEEYAISCDCRKPKTGMIERIEDVINYSQSFYVGDRRKDMELACNAKLNPVLIISSKTDLSAEEIEVYKKNENLRVFKDLLEFASAHFGGIDD